MNIPAIKSRSIPILLGVAYGIALRVLIAIDIDIFAGLVSISFFIVVPMIIGFFVVYVQGSEEGTAIRDFFMPSIAIVTFLVSTVVLLLEGSICVLMALPGFVVLAGVGGLGAGWLRRKRAFETRTLSIVLLLPLVLSPIESQFPAKGSIETRTDTVQISATLPEVWSQIVNVDEIDGDELQFGLIRALGVPRPIRAHMDSAGKDSIRYTTWDKGVSFQERMVSWSLNEQMTWEFEFPPGSIPDGVLDDHVVIGGQYFDLVSGGYSLSQLPDGSTELTLITSYKVAARPRAYALFWADLVMSDFQEMILDLVRDRAEANAG